LRWHAGAALVTFNQAETGRVDAVHPVSLDQFLV